MCLLLMYFSMQEAPRSNSPTITYQKGYFASIDAQQSCFFGDAARTEAQTELWQAELCSMWQTQL